MINILNLEKKYGSHPVLKGLSLSVKEGEIYGFIGHNGAGKSTTMNILAGLIDYQEGECEVNHHPVKKGSQVLKDIGYLPEDPKFYQYMNAWEYLSFIGVIGGDSSTEIKQKSKRLLEMVKLSAASKQPLGSYSRGMRQRLGIAVAMYHDPKVLLLDEPSSALDPEGRMDVISILGELKKAGKTVFLSTHILNDVERVCDRVGILNEGKIVVEDQMEALLEKYAVPAYDIEFTLPLSKTNINKLETLEYVREVQVVDKKICLWVEDHKFNSNQLLRELSELDMQIITFNLRKSTLEEIFMKVVK